MDTQILGSLLTQRIPLAVFSLADQPTILNKHDTPENRAIVADVVANYDTLAAQYEIDQKPIRERAAYKAEADPIYIEWQALLAMEHPEAENRRLEWLAKRAEIKERFK